MLHFKFLQEATLQEIFNKGYLGLAKQGFKKSYHAQNGCQYRGPKGLQCFIGQCMSDEEVFKYEKLNESVETLDLSNIVSEHHYFQLSKFRNIHDTALGELDMQIKLEQAARQFGLTIPTIPEVV